MTATPSGRVWQSNISHAQLNVGSVTASTTPTALPSQACSFVELQNDPDSTVYIAVGSSSAQYRKLAPGESITFNVTNQNVISYKTASSTATLNYISR